MRFRHLLQMRLRSVLRRGRVEDELDEELRYHLEREIDENIAAGMPAEEARFAALRAIGDLTQRQEECRDTRGLNVFENALKDARFAVRQLRVNPGFAATAVLMLALGICSAVAIFAFVDAALVKPLPYRNPGELVGVYEKVEPQCQRCNLSWPDYLDWKRQNTTFSSLDVYQGNGYSMQNPSGTSGAGSVPVRGARVSDGFFRTLGVAPILGRDFQPGEDGPGAERVAILSYSTWQKRYGGRASALGETVLLDRIPRTIVGVLPREFHFGPAGAAEYWLPFHPESECDLRRSCHGIYGVGRLKPGETAGSALANVTAIARALELQHPDTNRSQGANIAPLSEVIVGDVRPILLVLMAGAALLLLIATVDVAGLLLVRAESRRREMAMRSALGASSGRLFSQFAIEALALVTLGAGIGAVAAHWTMRLLSGLLSEDIVARVPFLTGLGWNGHVAAFTAAVSAALAALFAVVPKLRLGLSEIRDGLTAGSRSSTARVWRQLGSKLVIVEIATAVVLLVGSGLLAQSLYRLMSVPLGLRPEGLATVVVVAPDAKYAEKDKAIALARTVADRILRLPGVRSVGFGTNGAPLDGNGNTTWIRVLGRPWNGEHIDVPERDVSPNYFEALGAKLAQGRYFNDHDDAAHPRVAIVNEAFARAHFAGENPIGRQVGAPSDKPNPTEIVGVVEDVREGPLDEPIPPVLYRPFYQSPDTYLNLVVRTERDDESVLPEINRVVREIDPEMIPMRGAKMTRRVGESPSAYVHRTVAGLVGGFAGAALVLSIVGLYGVVMYSVSQRRREIGIRMAVGAQPGSVYRMVLSEAMVLTGIGVAAGCCGALGAARLIRGLLFGVSPSDPWTIAAVAGVAVVAAVGASFAPARRAARVDPAEALRAE